MKTYVVVGLGRFGQSIACRLCELGNEVLALDKNPEYVQLSVWAIRVFTFGIIPLALQYAFVDGLTALGILKVSVSLSVFRKALFLIFTLVFPMFWGASAAFYAEPVVDIFCGLFSSVVFLSIIGKILRRREEMADGESLYS